MNKPTVQTDNRQGNLPLYTLVATSLLILFGIAGALIAQSDRVLTLMVGLIVTTVPSLIAAGFAERASRDIRNGVVKDKVADALEETGVAQVARDAGETTPAALKALTMLIANLQATENAKTTHRKDPDNDGR